MMPIGEYRIHGFPITMRIPEPPGIPAIAPFHRGILEVSSNIPVIATVIDKPPVWSPCRERGERQCDTLLVRKRWRWPAFE
jgi:hypothetical protein